MSFWKNGWVMLFILLSLAVRLYTLGIQRRNCLSPFSAAVTRWQRNWLSERNIFGCRFWEVQEHGTSICLAPGKGLLAAADYGTRFPKAERDWKLESVASSLGIDGVNSFMRPPPSWPKRFPFSPTSQHSCVMDGLHVSYALVPGRHIQTLAIIFHSRIQSPSTAWSPSVLTFVAAWSFPEQFCSWGRAEICGWDYRGPRG